MEIKPEIIYEKSLKKFNEALIEYRKEWVNIFHSDFVDYINIFDLHLSNLKKILQKNPSPIEFWTLSKSLIHDQSAWSAKVEKLIGMYRQNNFWQKSDENFKALLKDFPEVYSSPVNTTDWDWNSTDNLDVFIWKHLKKIIHFFNIYKCKVSNRLQKLFKKQLLPLPEIGYRYIRVHPLISRYIHCNSYSILVNEWRAFQQRTSKIIYEFHQLGEQFLNILVMSEKASDFYVDGDYSRLNSVMTKMEGTKESINAKVKEFLDFEAPAVEIDEKLLDSFKQKWNYSGTRILPLSKYDFDKTKNEKSRINTDLEKSDLRWNTLMAAECTEWRNDLQFTLLQLKTIITAVKLIITTKNMINEEVIPDFLQDRVLVETSMHDIKSMKDLTWRKFISALKKENRKLIKGIGQEKTLLLIDTVIQSKLYNDSHDFFTKLTNLSSEVSEKQTILVKRDFDRLVPSPKTDEVPSKELLIEYGLTPLIPIHNNMLARIEESYKKSLRTISMLDQIIDFQVETAVSFLQKNKDDENILEAKSLLIDGFERIIGQIDDLIHENQEMGITSREMILQIAWNFIDSIQSLENSEQVFVLKMRLTKAKTKTKYKNFRKIVLSQSRLQVNNAGKAIKNLFLNFIQNYRQLRKFTGIDVSKARFEDEILDLITKSYMPLDKLPLVYQRLFRLEALSESRFYLHRSEEYDSMVHEFAKWEGNIASTVLLIGEKGSGKSTLLNHAKSRLYKDYHVYEIRPEKSIYLESDIAELLIATFKIENANSIDELETAIIEESESAVCVIENMQRFFMRKVGGFNALNRLLLFISRTSERIHWVVTSSLYSYDFIDKVTNISKYFHKLIHMRELSVKQIQDVIMHRHRTSGFALQFTASESILSSSKFKKLSSDEARQAFLADIFFDDLHEIANGNIAVAMLFWITAIKEIRKDQLVLHSILRWDQLPFQNLPADELFTFAAIIQHDGLTVSQHSEVFYQDVSKSQALLNRMMNNRTLIVDEMEYSIQPILYRPIVQVLKNKNILH